MTLHIRVGKNRKPKGGVTMRTRIDAVAAPSPTSGPRRKASAK